MRIEKIYSRPTIKLPQKINTFVINVIIIIVVAILTYTLITNALNPIIESLCMDKAKKIATRVANEQASAIMSKYKYEDIIITVKDSDGNIQMLQTNVKSVNEINSDITLSVMEAFSQEKNSSISVYLGSMFGIKALSTTGPKLNIKIANVGNVETKLKSEFTAQGINQTLHRIYMEVECEVTMLTPYKVIKQEIASQVLIAESVIVGIVPDSYYNIETEKSVNDSIKTIN